MSSGNKANMLSLRRQILYGLVDLALLVAGLANLGVGTWAAFQGNAIVAATSLTAGLVLLFAATIDRFESLKGLGIEAKTKQLDQKIVQADDALRRLREMTELTGAALIDLNSKMGRWDSAPGPRESIAFASRVRQIMKNLGSEESVIASALRPWAKTLCFDMASAQTRGLHKLLLYRLQALEAEQKKIKQPLQPDDPVYAKLSEQIRSIHEFQSSRLSNLHRLDIEDYPDKFMNVFDDVPQIDAQQVEALRVAAAKFAPGMLSLKQNQTLPDSELWIEELNKARDK
jgi:hypothetical protein